MKRLLLIRHGESEWNHQKHWQGHSDVPLSKKGRAQAGALAGRLLGWSIDHFYCSDSRRAVETAGIVGEAIERAATPDPVWREREVGDLAGMTHAEAAERYPDVFAASQETGRFDPPGGEGHYALRDRAAAPRRRAASALRRREGGLMATGKALLPALAAILLLTAGIANAVDVENGARRFTLRYGLSAGERFSVDYRREQSREVGPPDRRIVENTRFESVNFFHVEATGEEGIELNLRLGRRGMSSDLAGVAAPDFLPLEGFKTKLRLSATGERQELGDLDGFVVIPMPGHRDEYTPSYLCVELISTFPVLPEGPIAMGDGWHAHREFVDPAAGGENVKISLDYEYTLTRRELRGGREVLVIAVAVKGRVEGIAGREGSEFSFAMEGEGEGEFLFDRRVGMILGSRGTLLLEGVAHRKEQGASWPIRHEFRESVEVRL